MAERPSRRILKLCSASIVLALQSRAQSASAPDTLALRALNRTFHLIPGEFSIDLTSGQVVDAIPALKGLAAGYDHIVLGRYQKGDSVSFSLAFRRDSAGGLFGGFVTRRAPIESIEVAFETNTAGRAQVFLPQFRDAISELTAPQFCSRDTLANDGARAIVIVVSALWRRDDVTVLLNMTMNVMEPLDKNRQFAPRFYVGYRAMRRSNDLFSGRLPTRHDTPCFFSDEELREHGAQLDSSTYDIWRARLQRSSP